MSEFHAEKVVRQEKKMKELAPYIEEVFKRKKYMQPLMMTKLFLMRPMVDSLRKNQQQRADMHSLFDGKRTLWHLVN